ncbi:MAG: fibronectin type III domain-containing protein [Bacteroidales bacterium]|nr:fibronectin type III domain-containing protein [Bacteroidales bacterium]
MSLTGLTPNTNYYARAFATNGVGTAYGAQVGFVTPADIASLTTSAISAVTTTTASSGGVITSDGGSTILAKGICWSTSPNPVTGTATMTNDGSGLGTFTSSLTGLAPNTTYYVRSYAINGKGTAYGNELTFTTNSVALTAPGAPTIGLATKGNAEATVAFTAPASDGGSAITGYTATSNPGGLTGTGTASPITVSGLTNGTAYTFTVTATNGIGTGPSSTASNSVTPSTVPGAPVIGTATSGNAKATISFTAPDDGGTFITGYTVTSNPGGITGTGGSSPIDVTGLANIAYTFTVTATNANGTGAASAPSNSVTPTLIPGAPTIGTATAGDSYASVAFTPPVSDGGSAITMYKATANPGGLFGTGVVSPVNVTGLTNGTAYTFTVTATNINGTSPASAASNSVTPSAVPILTTISISNITSTTATSGGNITSNGGATVTASGVCWGTASGPVATGNHTSDGAVAGTYASTITGLTLGQTYYVRAYATNSIGTGYGNELSFSTTLAPNAVSGVATSVTSNSADLNAIVNANNLSTIVTFEYGTTIAYGSTATATPNPVTGIISTNVSAGLTGLLFGTTYHFRVKAVSTGGTTYGDDMMFVTLGFPTVTTTSITSITTSSASSGGNISNDGGASIINRGVCWSTLNNPTIADNKTSDGTGSGNFSSSISGLSLGTIYYVRAYATNSVGTSYGDVISFSTLNYPTITTTTITLITSTTSSSGGNITSDGGAGVTSRGVCWSTAVNPTILDPKTSNGVGIGLFSSNITSLSPGTTYHVRAYATNSVGTSYGTDVSFTTDLVIGDTYQGGIVGYILQSGDPGYISGQKHGIIVAQSDQSSGTIWGCYGTLISGADGLTLGTGLQNTIDIMAGCSTAGIAARLCRGVTINGYTDWYLPSKDELNILFTNQSVIGMVLDYSYWSSTEYTNNTAWGQNFNGGYQFGSAKSSNYHVRAIRAF